MEPAGIIALVATAVASVVAVTIPTSIFLQTRVRARLLAKKVPGRGTVVLGKIPGGMPELVKLLNRFEDLWVERGHGDRATCKKAWDRVIIEFVPDEFVKLSGGKTARETVKERGRHMLVATRKPAMSLGHTATVHGGVHLVLRLTPPHFDGDPDHEGDRWPGWTPAHNEFIVAVNASFRTGVIPLFDSSVAECGVCSETTEEEVIV